MLSGMRTWDVDVERDYDRPAPDPCVWESRYSTLLKTLKLKRVRRELSLCVHEMHVECASLCDVSTHDRGVDNWRCLYHDVCDGCDIQQARWSWPTCCFWSRDECIPLVCALLSVVRVSFFWWHWRPCYQLHVLSQVCSGILSTRRGNDDTQHVFGSRWLSSWTIGKLGHLQFRNRNGTK